MHSRQRWLVHRDVATTVDLLLRGQSARPQIRELSEAGELRLQEAPAPPAEPGATRSPRSPMPLPDPVARSPHRPTAAAAGPANGPAPLQDELPGPPPPLRVCGVGVSRALLEEAARSRSLALEVVEAPEGADLLLSLRGQLGREPGLRRRAQDLGLPILVIKSESLHQLQRALERVYDRRPSGTTEGDVTDLDDAHAALEECRLAVEQVVLPQGRPVELLPRSEPVRQMQTELVNHYRLRSAVFGRGQQQRLRVFPA
jgi:hypothetical protein